MYNYHFYRKVYPMHFNTSLADAVKDMARIIMVPYFRSIIVKNENFCPEISNLSINIFKNVYCNREMSYNSIIASKKIANEFISKISSNEKECLKFYFLSSEDVVKEICRDFDLEELNDDFDDNPEIAKYITERIENLENDELAQYMAEELFFIQDILDLDAVLKFDEFALLRVNENFSRDYLSNFDIDLIPYKFNMEKRWKKLLKKHSDIDAADDFYDESEDTDTLFFNNYDDQPIV